MSLAIYKAALSQKKENLKKRMALVPLSAVQDKARLCPPGKSFSTRLQADTKEKDLSWIMDIRKKSPFGDVFFDDKSYDPVKIALAAEKAGASAVAVSTDDFYAGGCMADFKRVREATNLPLILKDYIIDKYQVIEAKALEADCIMLYLTMLDDTQARIIEQTALQWGMDVIIIAHNEYEVERALSHLSSKFIALDNRDIIKTTVNLDNVRHLVHKLPKGYHPIATTGIKLAKTIQSYQTEGIKTVMIGETLQKQRDLTKLAAKLFPQS